MNFWHYTLFSFWLTNRFVRFNIETCFVFGIFLYWCNFSLDHRLLTMSRAESMNCRLVKGTQAWHIFEFFLTLIKSLHALGKFSKKFCLVSFDFCQNFEVRTFTRWLSIRGTKFFLRDIPTKFFKVEICILIRDFWVIFENYCIHMLSIRGTDIIACWAY